MLSVTEHAISSSGFSYKGRLRFELCRKYSLKKDTYCKYNLKIYLFLMAGLFYPINRLLHLLQTELK